MAAAARAAAAAAAKSPGDVYLMVRRKKTTIFLDMKENDTVLEMKRRVAGITKVAPENQRLFKGNNEMSDAGTLAFYGLNRTSTKVQLPATVGLVFRTENGDWEEVDIAPLSQPPELPDSISPFGSASH